MLGKLYLTPDDSELRILDNIAIHICYGTIADNRHGIGQSGLSAAIQLVLLRTWLDFNSARA